MKSETCEVFRANVAALITRGDQVLAFERLDYPGSWQCPQGGLDVGEEPTSAIWREVAEETGLTKKQLRLVGEYPDWLTYQHPVEQRHKFRNYGQTQRWFRFEFIGDESDISIDNREFSAWQWMDIATLLERVPSFKQAVFQKLQAWVEPVH